MMTRKETKDLMKNEKEIKNSKIVEESFLDLSIFCSEDEVPDKLGYYKKSTESNHEI